MSWQWGSEQVRNGGSEGYNGFHQTGFEIDEIYL